MLTFNKSYFLASVLLLLIEIGIAMFVHDRFIRPYVGDVLVVILMYCFVKSFFNLPVLPLSIAVFIFSCVIEALQFLKLVNLLGLQHSKLAKIILGSAFECNDILAYLAGFLLIIAFEYRNNLLKPKSHFL